MSADGLRLTERECEIVDAYIAGYHSDNEIAQRLGIKPATVSRHWANIYAKLGVNRRIKVALLAWGRDVSQPVEKQTEVAP